MSIIGAWELNNTIDLTALWRICTALSDTRTSRGCWFDFYFINSSDTKQTCSGFYVTLRQLMYFTSVDVDGVSGYIPYVDGELQSGYEAHKIIYITSESNNEDLVDWLNANGRKLTKNSRLYPGAVVAKGTTRQWRKLTTEEPTTIVPYLTFSSPNSFTLATYNTRKNWDGELEYSTDTTNWNVWDGTTTLPADSGKLYLRGTGNTVITGDDSSFRWVLTGSDIACNGNVENLLDYITVANGEQPTMAKYCYRYMFSGCTSLTTAPELPATTLAEYCYSYMFENCTSLTTAPELPATTLAYGCYRYMFSGCTSLTTAPELPATTLANGCYHYMFGGCTSLTTAPELPATTLAYSCYHGMFGGCTSLTTAPELPATTLANGCYHYMFGGCTSLTTAPELPATTLAYSCYRYMFENCTSIKFSATQTGRYQTAYRIPTSGTGTTATYALTNMFYGTGGTFTGTPSINTTYYTSNTVV